MQFKHQDEYSFFSSGQARLTPQLLYLHCGLIFVTFQTSVFYLFLHYVLSGTSGGYQG